MILRLPIPPSTNNLYWNVARRGRVKTTRYRDWIAAADLMLAAQSGITPIAGRACLTIRVPVKTRGDVSNRIKAIEDLLVAHGITGDDQHNWRVTIERAAVTEVEVEVTAHEL